ncbi:MAG: Acyl carrier protein [Firmicutes bacterium ADurb.Bin506]|nr:MAG: Acyl carrier protein [Firmicutes bacterium ADurb.Bin506]
MYDQLKSIIADQLGVEETQVTPEAKFVADLGADSLAMVEMVMAIEDKFGVRISQQEIKDLSSVGDALSLIKSRMGGAA